MAYPGYQNSLLLSQFSEFYQELARQKAVALAAGRGSSAPGIDDSPNDDDQHIAQNQDIWQRLCSLLETQDQRAARSGGAFGIEVYRDAQYVMAALADEIFLNEVWPGQQNWPLLETRFFQTFSAGETFFKKLDLLLRQRDPVYADLAAVYLAALSLGFQGKYRGLQADYSRQTLDKYRRQLFAMVYRRNPELLGKERNLFAQSYSHTITESSPVKLPRARNWALIFVALICLWLVVSHTLWLRLTEPIEQRLCQINQKSCAEGGK